MTVRSASLTGQMRLFALCCQQNKRPTGGLCCQNCDSIFFLKKREKLTALRHFAAEGLKCRQTMQRIETESLLIRQKDITAVSSIPNETQVYYIRAD